MVRMEEPKPWLCYLKRDKIDVIDTGTSNLLPASIKNQPGDPIYIDTLGSQIKPRKNAPVPFDQSRVQMDK